MILDTSALIALVREEPGAKRYVAALIEAPRRAISAGTLLEAQIVAQRMERPDLERELRLLIRQFQVEVVPFDAEQAEIARQAYRDFGKGSGHPARLNFGDCFAYALASVTGEPLLFKGDDFTHTDLRSALAAE